MIIIEKILHGELKQKSIEIYQIHLNHFNTLIFRNITDCVAGEDEGIWYCGREVMKSKKW